MNELVEIFDRVNEIYHSDLSWEVKYDLIFSPDISEKFCKLAPSFSWYDPDRTYEEDVTAFFDAVKTYLYENQSTK